MVTVPLFLLIGVFGNTLTVIIMNQKSFRKMGISVVLIALAVSDTTLNLMVPFTKRFFLVAVGYDPKALSDVGCKAFFWFWRTAKMTSSWLVLLIAIERFVVVCFPLTLPGGSSRKHSFIGACIVYLVIGGYNGAWVVFTDIVKNGFCIPNLPGEQYSQMLAKALVITGTSLYTHIPVVIIFTLNVSTIYKLVKQNKLRRTMSKDEAVRSMEAKTARMTGMLLGVSIAFLILVVPVSIMHVVSVFKGVNLFTTSDPVISVVREVVSTMEQLNYSINFCLYVACSEKYRIHMQVLLHLTCCLSEADIAALSNTSGQTPSTPVSYKHRYRKGSKHDSPFSWGSNNTAASKSSSLASPGIPMQPFDIEGRSPSAVHSPAPAHQTFTFKGDTD